MKTVRLAALAHARSGDKGDRADFLLFANDLETYRLLCRTITADRIAEHFASLAPMAVERIELDNLWAIKIVQGGGARPLRSDNLGKTLAARLLRMTVMVDQGNMPMMKNRLQALPPPTTRRRGATPCR